MSRPRTYELKRRAERQEETRRRIVEAAVDLHTTLGPSRTTVAAIAERAGVTRPTVYAHFPDARSLFQACSGHVRQTVPRPDPSGWRSISDPGERLTTALSELYAYYERLEQLFENVERDVAVMPVVAEVNASRLRYLEEARDVIVGAWPARGKEREHVRPAVGHALEFSTWQSLVRRQGCTRDEATRLMVELARSV
ncbi:MAG TPA: helix-turn-helix domain-containing protein [Gaiellaceae bacterium]|nr:helix-turn-helix domain-containing protein [Gaiellaceae bacterium]